MLQLIQKISDEKNFASRLSVSPVATFLTRNNSIFLPTVAVDVFFRIRQSNSFEFSLPSLYETQCNKDRIVAY